MTKRSRRNHSAAFNAKVALAAIKGRRAGQLINSALRKSQVVILTIKCGKSQLMMRPVEGGTMVYDDQGVH